MGVGNNGPMPTKVLVVEDHAMTRALLTQSLGSAGYDVVASCASTAEAMQALQRVKPDVALVDLHLGEGPTGLDLARILNRQFPHVRVVVLTSYEDPRLLSGDLTLDKLDVTYVVKQNVVSTEVIIEAIRRALAGSTRPLTAKVDLTDSQMETLRLMAEGLTNAEIAQRRTVTERAVEDTIRRVSARLDIDSSDGGNTRALLLREYFRMIGSPGV